MERATNASPSPRFVCHFCRSAFGRGDHLQRHLRSHEDDRAFICNLCSKAFTRADSLARHHRGRHAHPTSDAQPRAAHSRASRACESCSRSKLKCEGTQPCSRCVKRRLTCKFAARTSRRVKPVLPRKDSPNNTRDDDAEIPLEDTELEREDDSIQSINLDDQFDTPDSRPNCPMNNDNLYIDTHALDALSQAAGMANADFQQSGLEAHPCQPDMASSSQVGDHTTDTDLNSFPSSFPPTNTQMSPPASNTTQTATSRWSTMGGNPSPLPAMDYEASWDQLADIAEWTTLNCNYADPYLLSFTSFDLSPYNPSVPVLGQTVDYLQLDAMSHSAPRNEIEFAQAVASGPTPLRNDRDIRKSSHQSQARTSPMHIHSPSGVPQSGMPPLSSSGHDRDSRPNNIAFDDARQEQMLKNSGPWPTHWNPSQRDNLIGFPDMSDTLNDLFEAEDFAHVEPLSQKVYGDIIQCFRSVSSNQDLFKKFRESRLPPLVAFDCFIQLYFEFFQPMYPLLHQPTFNPPQTNFVLILAVASIGCRYSRSKEAKRCALPLSELTRRAILQAIEVDNSRVRETWLNQAQLLNNFSMLYSGDKRFLEVAQAHWGSLVVQTRRNRSLKEPVRPNSIDIIPLFGVELEAKWNQWRHEEARTRLGYMVWGLDSQLAMFFDINSSMDLMELQRKLPVREDVWEAQTPEAWKPLYLKYQPEVPDLHAALCDMKNSRTIPQAVGDLARTMIVQAIFATAWNVRQAFKNPLTQHLSPLADTTCRWRLQDQWRSMLDKLAAHPIMANESSPMAATVRNHTYHVMLLVYAPLTELLAFAGAEVSSSDKKEVIHQKLLAWIQDDNGRIVRRAILYASIIFNYIRTSSKSAFFEPFALLISTLTIWVYIQLKPTLETNVQPHIWRASISEREKQKTVRLDKPKDEQMVQMWIEDGAGLRGHISDVGNIMGPGAGQRLLQVACRALLAMEAWPLSQGFARVLSILGGKSTPVDKHG